MGVPLNEDQKRMFEEFLQELLLAAKNEAEIDLLLETLIAMYGNQICNQDCDLPDCGTTENPGSRYHLFKMLPGGVEWVGFVRGTEKAREMLLGLAVDKSAFYFLYDENSGEVLDLPSVRLDRPSNECN